MIDCHAIIGKCNWSVDVHCQKPSLSLLLICLFLFSSSHISWNKLQNNTNRIIFFFYNFQESADSAQPRTDSSDSSLVTNAQRHEAAFTTTTTATTTTATTNQNSEQFQRRFSYEIDPDIGVIVWVVFLWYSFSFSFSTFLSLFLFPFILAIYYNFQCFLISLLLSFLSIFLPCCVRIIVFVKKGWRFVNGFIEDF